jgi:hypothetical protein
MGFFAFFLSLRVLGQSAPRRFLGWSGRHLVKKRKVVVAASMNRESAFALAVVRTPMPAMAAQRTIDHAA